MEIKLGLESPKDLKLLWGVINLIQNAMIKQDMELCFKDKENPLFKIWHEETIDEWNRIQSIKKQIEFKLESLSETMEVKR